MQASRALVNAVRLLSLAAALVVSLCPSRARACHLSSLQHLSTEFVAGQWEVKVKVCVGGGVSGSSWGADRDTTSWGIAIEGPADLTSFEPAQLVGAYTGAVLQGVAVSDAAPLVVAPSLGACNDPNETDGQPYNCKHDATSALLFFATDQRRFTCRTSTAACGPVHQECHVITLRFAQKPNAFRVFGVEGDGNPYAGCYPNFDMALTLGLDIDHDGVFDSDDVCPGVDDRTDADQNGVSDCKENVDSDGDGVPDTDDPALCPLSGPDADGDAIPDVCDLCASDPHNDSDADGACDAIDACPFQPFLTPRADGRCGEFDGCGIQTASAVYGAGRWQVSATVCSRAINDGVVQRGVDTYTDNLLLAVYGEPSAIASFAPSQFRLDDGTLAPGRIAEPELLAEPAFASNAVECAFYQRTSAPCAAPGAAPTAALYYGLEAPLLSVWANTVPAPPICRTVTFETNQPPTRLHAFGLEGNGDLLGGCSLTHQASIVPVLVDGDADGDGVSDSRDACPSDFYNDRDGDGSCDGLDVCPLDPRDDADRDGVCGNDEPGCDLDPNNDLDADGVCAPADTCPLDAQNDADGDGLCADVDDWDNCNNAVDADGDATPDACDVCPHDYYNDSDGDGTCDSADPCPTDRLNDQDYDGTCDSLDSCPLDRLNDADHDGMCADVDPCPLDVANDADGDGICENADNCPGVANADQANQDGDSYGNACEPDADNDGFADDVDNCPLLANASQADTDGDALGDACDELDDDHDGIENARDRCAGTPVGAPVERHSGCSIAQACSPGAPWKNHGAYVACVTKVALALVLDHRMTARQAAAAVAQAAQSNVGKK